MLKGLIHFYDQKVNTYTYYFDLCFEETVIRMTSEKILYVLGGIRMIILGWMEQCC